MKAKLLKILEEAFDYYTGKAIDFEEAGKDEKMQEMFEITDAIEALKETLD